MKDIKMRKEDSSSGSLVHTLDTFVATVKEMEDTILVPSRLQDIELQSSSPDSAVVPSHDLKQQADLLAFYHMLHAIKAEVVHGPESDAVDEEENEDQSKKVAAAFRHHLQGLFGLLKQLTGTAKYLTHRYKLDIGECADIPSKNLAPFTL